MCGLGELFDIFVWRRLYYILRRVAFDDAHAGGLGVEGRNEKRGRSDASEEVRQASYDRRFQMPARLEVTLQLAVEVTIDIHNWGPSTDGVGDESPRCKWRGHRPIGWSQRE